MLPVDPTSPAPKRRRKKKPASEVSAQAPAISEDNGVIVATDDAGLQPIIDPETGSVEIPHEDGSVTIDLTGDSLKEGDDGPSAHDDNLADKIDAIELSRIAEELLTAIASDKQERSEWEQMRAKAIELMGLKIENPKGGVGSSSAPLEGMSVVRDPILAEAVYNFQADAYGELCPSEGPTKVVDYGDENAITDQLAEALQKDLNFYLTTTASEYYPDTRRMLFWTGLASGTFKKVYRCPLRRRPVSESVEGTNLIMPSNATDMKNAGRITHEIDMRRSVLKRMQILGAYRDVPLSSPVSDSPNAVQAKVASIEGVAAIPQRPEDQNYTICECYCELDIAGFEHKEDGDVTGLPLPYIVVIEADSRQILQIRRNWEEDDEDLKAKIPFVLFPYATGISIYGVGLGQVLGNICMALTAMLRESIDAGMFANFPGFLYAKDGMVGKQITNEFRVPPGGGVGLQTGGLPIGNAVMPLPYKDVSQGMVALIEQTRGVGQRLGGTASKPVGEGKQDAPVGTVLAMIEQMTKIEGAAHKALHAAQAEELQLLKELFREDPEALWRGNKRPALGPDQPARLAKFKAALERCEIVPFSDPNVPSRIHRLMKATTLLQTALSQPGMYDMRKVNIQFGKMTQIDTESMLAGPMPAPPDPKIVAAQMQAQQKQADTALKAQTAQLDAQTKAADLQIKSKDLDLQHTKSILDFHSKSADRKSKEDVALINTAKEMVQATAVHPEAEPLVDQQLEQWMPYLTHPGVDTAQ